jgi:hypothetical protein
LTFFTLAGCGDRKDSPEVKEDKSNYFNFSLRGDEESGSISARLQYKVGGAEGRAILLPVNFSVLVDGTELILDSSKMNGPWYERIFDTAGFRGPHKLQFKTPSGTVDSEEFEVRLFSLRTKLETQIPAKDLVLQVAGLKDPDTLRVLLTDTGFYSRGIDRIDTVRNGQLLIRKADLEGIKPGPVVLELLKEEEMQLDSIGTGRGDLLISYGLRRLFELKD